MIGLWWVWCWAWQTLALPSTSCIPWLWAQFGGGVTDNAVVVAQLYQNLYQQAPDAAAMRNLVQGLDAGQFSRADLVGVAAMQSINAVNIDLAGLSITGLEYLATPV